MHCNSQMQWLTEKALKDNMENLLTPDGQKLSVERPCQLIAFEEVADGVECKIKNLKTGTTLLFMSLLIAVRVYIY